MEALELHDAHVQAWRAHLAGIDAGERALLGEALALFALHNADVFDEPTAEDAFILAERLGVRDEVRAALAAGDELRERLDGITRGEARHA